MSTPELIKVGQTYNRWTVVERRDRRHSHRYWLVRCVCGNESEVAASHLRSGKSKSCGCLAAEKAGERSRLPDGESNFRRIYWLYKRDASRRGLDFEISREEFRAISKQPCHYCGTTDNTHNPRGDKSNGAHRGNGMDRVDNTRGYTKDNVVPCCSFCNYAKRDHDVEAFRAWIKRAYEHQFGEPSNVPALWEVV